MVALFILFNIYNNNNLVIFHWFFLHRCFRRRWINIRALRPFTVSQDNFFLFKQFVRFGLAKAAAAGGAYELLLPDLGRLWHRWICVQNHSWFVIWILFYYDLLILMLEHWIFEWFVIKSYSCLFWWENSSQRYLGCASLWRQEGRALRQTTLRKCLGLWFDFLWSQHYLFRKYIFTFVLYWLVTKLKNSLWPLFLTNILLL